MLPPSVAGVADLRAGHAAGGRCEQAEVFTDLRIVLDLRERGQRTNLEATTSILAHTLQGRDAGQIDHCGGAPGAVLQPVQLSCPPPTSQPSSPRLAASSSACSSVAGWYRSKCGHHVLQHFGLVTGS